MKHKMTSKDRVLTALARQEPDRVPIDYMGNPGIDARLKKHFGLAADDAPGLRDALGVDSCGAAAPYTGPVLHVAPPERRVDPQFGWRMRYVEHQSGGYWDLCDFPLQDADVEAVARWPMPSPDDFDYSGVAEACRRQGDKAVYAGHPGLATIMNTAGFFRGMEQAFVDLALDDPAGLLLIDRFMGIQLEVLRRELEAAQGGFDFLWMGEDLGTQRGPIISLEMFHKHIKPRHQPFFDLARAYHLPVMMHMCGSSSWSFDEYIPLGLTAADALQPEAVNMAPDYLKKTFGDRLSFHGCVSTAGVLAHGTVADVERTCRRTLEIMMPGGGYIFAPTHMIQDNTPTENALAMYRVAQEDGCYR